ncbi:UDP-3-O-(3-hydroxymyristoyl)glucosamine N-acyltransferase [Marinomonas sp.]
MSYTLAQLAEKVQGEVKGDGSLVISGLGTLEKAGRQQLSFLANPKYANQLKTSAAGAVLVKSMEQACTIENAIITKNPYLAFAQLSHLFVPQTQSWTGVHASATISDQAQVAADVTVGPNSVIDAGATIGSGTVIGANCVISRNTRIGCNGRLYPNVTIYHDVTIGDDCILHSGCVIGADGFGFAPRVDGWEKINQLGGVEIGSQVEVGANTTIDRGALENTRIGNGVKIDNQVQIAHNVIIGDNSAIAGGVMVAGSVNIGEFCTISGGSGITGHLTLTDRVHITAMSLISHSILEAGSYSSGTGMEPTSKWRKTVARIRRLDETAKQVLDLRKQVNKLLEKVDTK